MTDHGLTSQQEAFAQALARGMSQADAYREAYPKAKAWKAQAVHVAGSKLMANTKVSVRVSDIRAAGAVRAELDVAALIEESRRLAMSDIAGICKPDGTIKLPHELDAQTRAAVKSFKITKDGIEYTFWDKNAAIDRLFKHAGLYEKDNEQKTNPLDELARALAGNVVAPGKPVPGLEDDDDAAD